MTSSNSAPEEAVPVLKGSCAQPAQRHTAQQDTSSPPQLGLPPAVQRAEGLQHPQQSPPGAPSRVNSAFAPHQQQCGQGTSWGLSLPICEMGRMLESQCRRYCHLLRLMATDSSEQRVNPPTAGHCREPPACSLQPATPAEFGAARIHGRDSWEKINRREKSQSRWGPRTPISTHSSQQ